MRNGFGVGVLMVLCGARVAVGVAHAAPATKIVTDIRKACQAAVPSDWTTDLSTAYSPGKKISATVHGLRADDTFASGKDVAKQAVKPIKVLQDDAKRLFYTMDPGPVAPGKSGWYIVANTRPVCTLSFTFDAGADEAMLKTIADSLAPVAK
jgi:hypothetical protein